MNLLIRFTNFDARVAHFPCVLLWLLMSLTSFAQKPSHQIWHQLLQKHVDRKGWVDYKGFTRDSHQLNKYLQSLEKNAPNSKWSRNETMAFWINAYNAYTIQLVIRHPAIRSMQDIQKIYPSYKSAWDIPFIRCSGKKLDLNTLEHELLRKRFQDPRIHMALVCAAVSCPALLNKAYKASTLEKQLHQVTRNFLRDTTKNQVMAAHWKLSSIFEWYAADFGEGDGVIRFIERYGPVPKNAIRPEISYMPYDWSLNGHF